MCTVPDRRGGMEYAEWAWVWGCGATTMSDVTDDAESLPPKRAAG